jgi:hypothetical protein
VSEPSTEPHNTALPLRAEKVHALLREFRSAQKRNFWMQGFLWSIPLSLTLVLTAGLVGKKWPEFSFALLVASPIVFVVFATIFALVKSRIHIGSLESTARHLASTRADFKLDLLAAIELSHSDSADSKELTSAFFRQLDSQVASYSAADLLDSAPLRKAALVMSAMSLVLLGAAGLWREKLKTGFSSAFTRAPETATKKREPIAGDTEVTLRFPAYMKLETQTLTGVTDLSVPFGTQIQLVTRADRDVEKAALVLGAQLLPMEVLGRKLTATFVATQSAPFHVAFMKGEKIKVEGPDNVLTVKPDAPPEVVLIAPDDALEVMPDQTQVLIKFTATDDYGISALTLVYRTPGSAPLRTTLHIDSERTTRGEYAWVLAPLNLREGQTVSYYVEAKDNNSGKPQEGVSATHTLTKYSAEEHRREALKKAEVVWNDLVLHLADRMEGSDRKIHDASEPAMRGRPIDAKSQTLVQDFAALHKELMPRKEVPDVLLYALANIRDRLSANTVRVTSARSLIEKWSSNAPAKVGITFKEKSSSALVKQYLRELQQAVAGDITDSESDVLYLEALLNREKIEAIKSLADEMKESRKELSKILDEYARTKSPELKEALAAQMQNLRQRLQELAEKMNEISKGMRDEFVNQEAVEEMLADQDMNSKMAEIEKLINEGKVEEAMKKMQELSMQMDEFLDNIDGAAEKAEQNADPELVKQFEEFNENLQKTIEEQQALAAETAALKEKYAAQQKQRIDRQAAAVKASLEKKLAKLKTSLGTPDEDRYGSNLQEKKKKALQQTEHIEEALKADDFDLALQSAEDLEREVSEVESLASEQRINDEMYQNPREVQKKSKQLEAQAKADMQTAQEVASTLRSLFPPIDKDMSEADKEQSKALSKRQEKLKKQADELSNQMDALNEKAPILNDDAQQQMSSAQESMGKAAQRLGGRDPGMGYGNQQSAMESLKQIQQSMQQSGQGKKGGLPLPMKQRGNGRSKSEKVEIPEEDANQAAREFRKDVVEAMKQGAPDKYKEQNKKYYEELVQ